MATVKGFEQELPLPPTDLRLVASAPHVETPVDERGLVDVQQLIDIVKTTVDPSHRWPNPPHNKPNIHHFYWPGDWYQHDGSRNAIVSPAHFRNLPIHRGNIPRQFENWLHVITIPPPVPDAEVMAYRVEAWAVAKDLFRMARNTVTWERKIRRRRALLQANPDIIQGERDEIGEEIMEEILRKNFRGLDRHLRRHSRVPSEFSFLSGELTPSAIANDLGKLVVPSSQHLVRAVTGG